MRLKMIALKALLYIGVGIELLLIIYMFLFARSRAYAEMLLTGLLFAIPIIGLILFATMSDKRIRRAEIKRINRLRTQGIALRVDLTKCIINEDKRIVYYDRQDLLAYSMGGKLHDPRSLCAPDLPAQSFRSQAVNAWRAIADPDLMHERFSYDRTLCIVSRTVTYQGRQITFFSDPIFMDKSSLEVYLALYQEGLIYLNPQDDNDYFFDLTFLKQEGS